MILRKLYLSLSVVSILASCSVTKEEVIYTEIQNPVIPGYFADPSLVQHEGKFYLYATADPWGGDFLACWESSNFRDWTFSKLNWPTKEACTSPLSGSSMVWAPSVIKKGDKFYMYVSVGSEVWCGVADHPLGPWKNMLGDKQLIEYDTTRYYHPIDAEVFIDDDQRTYLYWGSGWDWKNGKCYVAELNDDMCTFKTEKKDVTPTNYFEAPFVIKHNSKYYLTYSEGRTMDDTYEVRYGVSDSPLGPFAEAANSPILKTDKTRDVYGPGHHTLFSYEGKDYMLYHRHRLPFVTETAYRQICLSEISFDEANSQIKNIIPVQTQAFPEIGTAAKPTIPFTSAQASSESSEFTGIKMLSDNSYATRWEVSQDDKEPHVSFDFESGTAIESVHIRFEYPWKNYYFQLEISSDGQNWTQVADYRTEGISGSPVIIPVNAETTQVKISFDSATEATPSIWEISFY